MLHAPASLVPYWFQQPRVPAPGSPHTGSKPKSATPGLTARSLSTRKALCINNNNKKKPSSGELYASAQGRNLREQGSDCPIQPRLPTPRRGRGVGGGAGRDGGEGQVGTEGEELSRREPSGTEGRRVGGGQGGGGGKGRGTGAGRGRGAVFWDGCPARRLFLARHLK